MIKRLRLLLFTSAFLFSSGAAITTYPVNTFIQVQGWDPMRGECLVGEIDGNYCSLTSGTLLCKFSTSVNATTFDQDCRFPTKVYKKKIDM